MTLSASKSPSTAAVHGELDALQALRAQMLAAGFPNVHIPKMHETLQIP